MKSSITYLFSLIALLSFASAAPIASLESRQDTGGLSSAAPPGGLSGLDGIIDGLLANLDSLVDRSRLPRGLPLVRESPAFPRDDEAPRQTWEALFAESA
jgi:hypothetical protein